MSFDPTGCTLAHEHLHIDLSGFKNNVAFKFSTA